jgi:outer membrane protein
MKKIFLLLTFCWIGMQSSILLAQKFGHVNSATLIESHPKVPAANTQLEEFRKTAMAPLEAKAKEFESRYNFFIAEVNAGTLSKVSAQTRQQELAQEQQALQQEQEQIEFSILQKREQLLQPILTELDSIIQTVGKEGQFTMIFDTSVTGALLYAVESEDLTSSVQARIKE